MSRRAVAARAALQQSCRQLRPSGAHRPLDNANWTASGQLVIVIVARTRGGLQPWRRSMQACNWEDNLSSRHESMPLQQYLECSCFSLPVRCTALMSLHLQVRYPLARHISGAGARPCRGCAAPHGRQPSAGGSSAREGSVHTIFEAVRWDASGSMGPCLRCCAAAVAASAQLKASASGTSLVLPSGLLLKRAACLRPLSFKPCLPNLAGHSSIFWGMSAKP